MPLLLTILRGERASDDQRAAAAQALVQVGAADPAWHAIEPRLASAEETERWAAVVVLAGVPAPAAVPQLGALARPGNPRGVRLAAVAALGTAAAREPAAVKPLGACLKDGDAALRAACAQALAMAGHAGLKSRAAFLQIEPLLKDRDERVRAAAVLAAAALGGARFSGVLYLFAREKSPVVRAAFAEALVDVPGAEAFSWLRKLAASPDLAVRRKAAGSLSRRSEPEARALVAGFARDADPELRRLGLAAVDSPDELRGHLSDPSSEVKAAALAGLVRLRGAQGAVADAARLLAEAGSRADRAEIAGGWLIGQP